MPCWGSAAHTERVPKLRGATLVIAVLLTGGLSLIASGATTAAAAGATSCKPLTIKAPERLHQRFSLAPGESKRRKHRAGRFRNGVVAATFVMPRRAGGPLHVRVDTRVKGGTGYRTKVRRGDAGRMKLVLVRAEKGRTTRLARTTLPQRINPGQRLRIKVKTRGARVRAKAWIKGTPQPRWQLALRDRDPLLRHGRAAVWVKLAKRADRRVTVRVRHGVVKERRRGPHLGVYNGMYDEAATVRQFGSHPGLANSYYQPDQTINLAEERTRIRHGTSPNITLTAKGTQHYAALAEGRSHPGYAAANAWLNRYVTDLARLARTDVRVPVYATLDHEFTFKVRTGLLTGDSADPAVYGKALRIFYARARRANPDIRVTYWMVGFDRVVEGAVAKRFRTPPDAVLFDPYAKLDGTNRLTLRDVTVDDARWIRRQAWYVGQEIGLGEFGMQVGFGEKSLKQFHTDLPDTMRAQRISWGVFFNRQKHLDTKIIERSDAQEFPGAVSAFRDSLSNAC